MEREKFAMRDGEKDEENYHMLNVLFGEKINKGVHGKTNEEMMWEDHVVVAESCGRRSCEINRDKDSDSCPLVPAQNQEEAMSPWSTVVGSSKSLISQHMGLHRVLDEMHILQWEKCKGPLSSQMRAADGPRAEEQCEDPYNN
ncbi:unnamed protein product, partial [Amoebophrya sp. A120]|eukprot:GSA120T00008428001.1